MQREVLEMLDIISIIVPVYNAEKYLRKCVESILIQTYDKLEIILIDDGSKDSSPEICDLFLKKDSRVKVIHKENGGVSSARNEGLRVATGKYIGFVDGDDWIEIDYFQKLYDAIVKYDTDISICGYVSETSNEIISKSTTLKKANVYNNLESIEAMFDGSIFMGHLWNKLYKVELLRKLSFNNNIHMYEDLLFNVQVMVNVKNIVFIPSFGYHYIRHEESACNKINTKYSSIIRAYSIIRDNILEELPDALKYCNKSEIRTYIMTAIRIIENGSEDETINEQIVKATRRLIIRNKNFKDFGIKYLMLGLILMIGLLPFKIFYIIIGKRFL